MTGLEKLSSLQEYAELRRQFTEEWMRAGDCTVVLCTEMETCGALGHLLQRFGIEELKLEEKKAFPPQKVFEANELLESILSDQGNWSEWQTTFQFFNYMRHKKMWLSTKPFEGWMEVPHTVGDVLHRYHWEQIFSTMDEQGMLEKERIPIQRMFMRSFVDALFPDHVLEEIERHTKTSEFRDEEYVEDPGWLTGVDSANELTYMWSNAGLTPPRIPEHLVEEMGGRKGDMDHGTPCAWEFIDAYMPDGVEGGFPRAFLEEVANDYLLWYERSNGYSAFDSNITRAGGLMVWQQATFEDSPSVLSVMVEAQNRYLAPLFDRVHKKLSLAIGYSQFRGYAFILSTDKKTWRKEGKSQPECESFRYELPKGWGVVASLGSANDLQKLQWVQQINRLQFSDDINAAVRYFTDVVLQSIARHQHST